MAIQVNFDSHIEPINNTSYIPDIKSPDSVFSLNSEGEKQGQKKPLQPQDSRQDDSLLSRLMDGSKEAKQDLLKESLQMRASGSLGQENTRLQEKVAQNMSAMFADKAPQEEVVTLSSQVSQKIQLGKPENKRTERGASLGEDVAEERDKAGNPRPQNFKKQLDQQKRSHGRGKEGFASYDTEENMQIVKKYAGAFAQYAGKKKAAKRQEMLELKKQLKHNGLSSKQIHDMEVNVGQMVKQHHAAQLKKGLLKYYFSHSESNQETLEAKLEYNIVAASAGEQKQAGMFKSTSHDLLPKLGVEVRRELEPFIFEEVSELAVKHRLGALTEKDFVGQVYKLQKIAEKAGLPLQDQLLITKIENTIEDLGLNAFVPPAAMAQQGQGDAQEQEKETPKVYLDQETLLEDKLRHLYYMKAMNPSVSNTLSVTFKIKKLKNGLLKLGVFSHEAEDQLKKEGLILAEIKLRETLADAYREQATLPVLSGDEYNGLRKQKDWALKRLKKVGVKLTHNTLQKIRDEANKEIYPFIKEQMNQFEVALEVKHLPSIHRQLELMKEILTRLKKETPQLEQKESDFVCIKRIINEAA